MYQHSEKLQTLIKHIMKQTIPEYMTQATDRVKKDAKHLDELLNQDHPPRLYGVNTLVGHLDHVSIHGEEISAFQTYLLDNHMIGTGEAYSDYETRCISYAKLHSFSLGGTGITPDLYEHLLQGMKEKTIKPIVPKHASYSSGDVIPAAHWAKEVANVLKEKYQYSLQRKEGLSLINGSFVHVGIATAKLLLVQSVWSLYNSNSVEYAKILNKKRHTYSDKVMLNEDDTMKHPLNWIKEGLDDTGDYTVQDPVSVRAYPQVASAFFNSIQAYMDSIEEQLARRSDNPIILYEEEAALSQASFLAPMISLATSQLIEALLLAMWGAERRLHFLLSGKVKGIPLNAGDDNNVLGLIQVPKMVTAILEQSRLIGGRRTFASGSSTSYGVEDIWTNGLSTLEVMDELLRNMNKILSIEKTVICYIQENFLDRIDEAAPGKNERPESFREQYEQVMYANMEQELDINYNQAPFHLFE
ncbi:aromatic amino acid lyase [Virgibacillus sp. W0181]|uniref:aromatic amino acid lyase n=1 Tax=Virgibacillus sp. W0181 TaxID=3391581 RepID=UPI003F44AE3F